jgi:hypothetical protein
MGRIIQFPRKVLKPFRLEGEADLRAGLRAVRLLKTSRYLEMLAHHRKRQDSPHLQQLEAIWLRQQAREEADVETLAQTTSVAQLVAPEVLRQLELGERTTLLIARQDTGRGASFECAKRGIVLVADRVALLPGYR